MFDVRNLIFPMTAGDLVDSAVVVGINNSHGGMPLRFEVVSAKPVIQAHHVKPGMIMINFKNQLNGETFSVVLKADTPLLVTNIRRS